MLFPRLKAASLVRRLRIAHALSFFNTRTSSLEAFAPLGRTVKMYNCGPTVYDFQHIGNLRPYVTADSIRRALRFHGHKVEQVINITDVGHLVSDADEGEDKIELGARREGKSVAEITSAVAEAFFADLDALGIDRSLIRFPRATEFIGEQIALVQTLEEKGYAYAIQDGVYFDTSRFKEYGALGSVNLEGLREGARVSAARGKRHPTDFALWKFSKPDEQRLQEWDSPWGKGFPGWHIECTAMIFKLLGRQIDIHTGGIEHIPVHHNNELAQAESASGKRFVKYWLHNDHITIEGKKISKSLGNTIYLRNIVDRGFSPLALRYWFLTGHYRSPMNFTWEALEGSDSAYKRLVRHFFEELPASSGPIHEPFADAAAAALSHDLDTPRIIALLWDIVKNDSIPKASKRASILFADDLLGLGLRQKIAAGSARLTVIEAKDLPDNVKDLIDRREEARRERRFDEADALRDSIERMGYSITDTPDGPSVRQN